MCLPNLISILNLEYRFKKMKMINNFVKKACLIQGVFVSMDTACFNDMYIT